MFLVFNLPLDIHFIWLQQIEKATLLQDQQIYCGFKPVVTKAYVIINMLDFKTITQDSFLFLLAERCQLTE